MAEFIWGIFVGAGFMSCVWAVCTIADTAHKARGYDSDQS